MNALESARQEIEAIDRQIAQLYEQRMLAAAKVLQYKKENGLPILDAGREETLLERNTAWIQDERFKGLYQAFQKFVMNQSKDFQQSLLGQDVVAYQGVEGAFSHMVSTHLYKNNPKLACSTFEEVFQAVVGRKARYGIIPFENTNSGLVGEVMDLLLEYPVYIQAYWNQPIEQCLLVVPGTKLQDIRWVYSKDQALAQSRTFLEALGAQPVAYPNTAMAAQYVAASQDKSKAAIGARENAALYNLEVLPVAVQENASNTTRFLIIGDKPAQTGNRLGLCVSVRNEVGALAKVIEIVSDWGLNMCSIQSRPLKNHPFEYFFFIELEPAGPQCEQAIAALKEVCEQIKPLGRYEAKEETCHL
jgi:chorismate mutase/prephenate dehydratase